MKKTILVLLFCAILTVTVSCNTSDDIDLESTAAITTIQPADSTSNALSTPSDTTPKDTETNNVEKESENLKSRENPLPENTELIYTEKHFQIYEYKDAVNKHFYRILDSNGNTVVSETTTRPLSINMVGDNIIDISISFGSGVSQHRYYSIDKNILSSAFFYVFATSGELIAYMNTPKDNAMGNRTLVIQNVFDKEVLFVEYELDFSNYVIPIEKIEFLKNSNSLQLTYYKGSKKELTTDLLNY